MSDPESILNRTPAVEIDGAAIDRASLQCRDIWHRTRRGGEGLHSWLMRVAAEALETGVPDRNGYRLHQGMALEFASGGEAPVLRSVMRAGAAQRRDGQKMDRMASLTQST
jgi:hypothetical protein